MKVTVLADRGFGDQALYELPKDQLGFVHRSFRGVVKVTSTDGVTKPTKAMLRAQRAFRRTSASYEGLGQEGVKSRAARLAGVEVGAGARYADLQGVW